jgi:hypothetical protein
LVQNVGHQALVLNVGIAINPKEELGTVQKKSVATKESIEI